MLNPSFEQLASVEPLKASQWLMKRSPINSIMKKTMQHKRNKVYSQIEAKETIKFLLDNVIDLEKNFTEYLSSYAEYLKLRSSSLSNSSLTLLSDVSLDYKKTEWFLIHLLHSLFGIHISADHDNIKSNKQKITYEIEIDDIDFKRDPIYLAVDTDRMYFSMRNLIEIIYQLESEFINWFQSSLETDLRVQKRFLDNYSEAHSFFDLTEEIKESIFQQPELQDHRNLYEATPKSIREVFEF